MRYFSEYEGSLLVSFGRADTLIDYIRMCDRDSDIVSYAEMSQRKFEQLLSIVENAYIAYRNADLLFKIDSFYLLDDHKSYQRMYYEVLKNGELCGLGSGYSIEEYKEKYWKDDNVLIAQVTENQFTKLLNLSKGFEVSYDTALGYGEKYKTKYFKTIEEGILQGYGRGGADCILIESIDQYRKVVEIELTKSEYIEISEGLDEMDDIDIDKGEGYITIF